PRLPGEIREELRDQRRPGLVLPPPWLKTPNPGTLITPGCPERYGRNFVINGVQARLLRLRG
ncbi:MAG: hypothetical protein ACUVS1_08380, partial [Actinomycetota bacterium]